MNKLQDFITWLKTNSSTTKHILKSKTFWVNFLTLVASVSGYLPPKYTAFILPIANILLRIVTTDGVTIFES